jgi:thioredoxin 1
MANGRLLAIDDSNFDTMVMQSSGRILVEVSGQWCGPCRQMKPALERLAEERIGSLRVGILDMDEAPAAAASLGVRGAPTFIVFEDGKEIARQLGAVPPTVLRALVDRPSAA